MTKLTEDLTHSPRCGSTTFHLRWDDHTPNQTYPGLLVCDECDWSAAIEMLGYRCKRCNAPMRYSRQGAQYCSGTAGRPPTASGGIQSCSPRAPGSREGTWATSLRVPLPSGEPGV